MLRHLFAFAATRVAGDAIDGVARRAMWGAFAALMLLAAFVLSLMIAFWTFEPVYGAVPTAAAIAGACAALAVIALLAPAISDWRKRRAARAAVAASPMPAPVAQAAAAVQDEAEAAVDYFGALQVVASAFVFGLGAARQIRGR